MGRIRYAVGVLVGIAAGLVVGLLTGIAVLGVLVALIVPITALYLIWERWTLGANAGDMPERERRGREGRRAPGIHLFQHRWRRIRRLSRTEFVRLIRRAPRGRSSGP